MYKINSCVWLLLDGGTADHPQDNELDVPSSPVATKRAAGAAKGKQPASEPAKRQSNAANGQSRKKQKTESGESSEELSSSLSGMDSASEPETKPKKNKKSQKPAKNRSPAARKSAKSKPEPVKSEMEDAEEDVAKGEKSDSELSVLIDEDPQPKKKGKRKDSQGEKPKTDKATKAKAPAAEDQDQAEIKRLQGWLVKCGIRKLWGKELKPYETPKAKIKHLKDMLTEVGMAGRYSQEKANQIKEARELAADIEAVQEGEERWGKGDKEDAEDDQRPQKRLVRGAKNYDFLSSDGEETD